jgi:hypothetical protein
MRFESKNTRGKKGVTKEAFLSGNGSEDEFKNGHK